MSSDQFAAAVRCFQAGDRAGAEQACRAALQLDANHVDALHMLGMLLSQSDRTEEAVAMFRQAIAIRPRDAILCNNLGEVYRQHDMPSEAIPWYQRAVEIAPGFPEAHFNLGNVLKKLEQMDAAIAAFRRAVELRPGYAKAHYNLGNVLREEGRVKTAVTSYERAIEVQPTWAEPHLNLANTYAELGEPERAIVHYQRAQALDPTNEEVDASIGHAHLALGRIAEAKAAYARELARRPGRPLAQFRIDALCETIALSGQYIDDYYAHLLEVMDQASERIASVDMAELHSSGAEPPMALAYHGRDVRPLLDRYHAMFADKIPSLDPLRNTGKPRLGVLVTHGHEGVFARCWGGIAERLSRSRLDVNIVCSRAGANLLKQMLRLPAAEYFVIPSRLDEAAERLRVAKFDWLHYWEIGTDSTNYFLPYFCPAARQSGCWGWPVTSGNPAVDFYLSSRRLEPPLAERHYREELVCLEHLPTCYERPPAPKRLPDRKQFKLSEGDHFYLCTQNLRKYHPDFDVILASLLRTDPRGQLRIIADAQPPITSLLMDRFRRRMPDVCDRIQVLPRLERDDYLGVLAVADVVLDTLYYGGGANTVYDAVSVGTPIVTLPGLLHRSRWTLATYNRLGITETIANSAGDYVRLAHLIAEDANLRRDLAQRILAASPLLFEDENTVREHEEFFCRKIEEARRT